MSQETLDLNKFSSALTSWGGPAFPSGPHTQEHFGTPSIFYYGMTLRDYFAAAALQGWLANGPTNNGRPVTKSDAAEMAQIAYHFADSMLAEREKK